ncbi:HepT-like ribonuclease domain-containing protein [Halalkalibaculum sp. DA384]
MRDIITHHYFDIDAETVFTVCDEHVPQLERIIKLIRREL